MNSNAFTNQIRKTVHKSYIYYNSLHMFNWFYHEEYKIDNCFNLRIARTSLVLLLEIIKVFCVYTIQVVQFRDAL